LFESIPDVCPAHESMAEGAVLLRGFAVPLEADLLAGLRDIVEQAPFRHMVTPGGHQMSVAMTNCGGLGWVTDRSGYRYDANDTETGKPWPAMTSMYPPRSSWIDADRAAAMAARIANHVWIVDEIVALLENSNSNRPTTPGYNFSRRPVHRLQQQQWEPLR
jgi:alkylated DNA repair dioxygenase AlkB